MAHDLAVDCGALASGGAEVPAPARAPRRARSDRLARQLALAHWIERAIEAGEVDSYGALARALGISQPRVSQIIGLLLLPPSLQERVLVGGVRLGIRAALLAAREAEWKQRGKKQPGAHPSSGLHLLNPGAHQRSALWLTLRQRPAREDARIGRPGSELEERHVVKEG